MTTVENMSQVFGKDKEFLQEFEEARKERNALFDSINKSEKHWVPKAQEYIELWKANNRVFEILYFLR